MTNRNTCQTLQNHIRNLTIAALLFFPTAGYAQTVTNTDGGESNGSFRKTVNDAATGATITFASGIDSILLGGEAVNDQAVSLSILGNAAGTTLDGAGNYRILNFEAEIGDVLLENLVFQNATNRQSLYNDYSLSAETFGGAVFGLGAENKIMTIRNSRFLDNGIDVSGTDVTARFTEGFGGAIYTENFDTDFGVEYYNLEVIESEFSRNRIDVTTNDNIEIGTQGRGGAICTGGHISILDSTFVDNVINAFGGERSHLMGVTATADGFGGAIYAYGATIEGTSFINNKVLATGGVLRNLNLVSAEAYAEGGAIHNSGDISITSSVFVGNEAVATGGNGHGNDQKVEAWGGALQIWSPTAVVITDTSFLDNKAVAIQTTLQQTATAQGGAISLDALYGHAALTLAATEGNQTVFRGNKEIVHWLGPLGHEHIRERANSFALVDYEGRVTIDFLVQTEAGGLVALDDPFYTTNSTGLDMIVEGAGEFRWGGENSIGIHSQASVHFKSGTVTLSPDFTLIAPPKDNAILHPSSLHVEMDSDVKLNLDLTDRNTELAMFDDPEGTMSVFTVNNVDLSAATYSLDPVNERYLITNNRNSVDETNFNVADDGLFAVSVSAEGTNLYVSIDNTQAIAPIVNSPSVNLQSVRQSGALNTVYNDVLANVDPSDRAAIFHAVRDNPQHLVPEAVVSQGQAALGSMTYLSQALWQIQGADVRQTSASNWRGQSPCEPVRMRQSQRRYAWGGFVGNHIRQENTGGYYGYKNSMNGGIFGVDLAATRRGEIGVFLAFAEGKTTYDSLASRVDTEVFQTGLYGTWRPNRNWSIRGDFAYGYFDNDSSRMVLSEHYTGSFKQNVYNVGLLAKRDYRWGSGAALSPYFGLRYQHLDQDAMRESGSSGFASAVDGLRADSFASTLGVATSLKMQSFTPTLYVDWRHEFADRGFSTSASYVGAPQMFRIGSSERVRDSVNLGFDVAASWRGSAHRLWELHTGYMANLAQDYAAQAYYVTLGVRF